MIRRYFCSSLKRNFSFSVLWIAGGSDKDTLGKKGLNNILCSLLTRGCQGFDNLAFSDYINLHGAELHQEVLEDGMLISLRCLDEHFTKLLLLLELMISKPTLSEIQFSNVKKSAINSIKKDKENNFNICFDKWRKIVYQNHPYSHSSIGYEKDILNIKYSDVLKEFDSFKSRDKFLISNNKKVIFKKNNFTEDQKTPEEVFNKTKNIQDKRKRFISSNSHANQIIFMLGNQTCSRLSDEYLTLKILESHLSFGMSSILFKLFREKNGITYDAGVFYPVRRQNSPFMIYLSVSNKNALLAFTILHNLWQNLLSSLITDEDLRLAKEKLKGSFLISNESIDEVLQRRIQLIGFNFSNNFSEDYSSKIDLINPEIIKKSVVKYFSEPFLSINGEKKICDEIGEKWLECF